MPKEYVEELRALPIGLTKIDTVDSYPIYSSEHLTNNFLAACASMRNLRPCLPQIQRLIYTKTIIPAVSYSGLLKYIIMNTFSHNSRIPINGAYLIEKDVIYIVADMKLSDFFNQHLEATGTIILHELMHYCSSHNPRVYNAIFKDTNATFFMDFFREWVAIEIGKNAALELNDYALKNFELGKNRDSIKYARFLDSILPPMPASPLGSKDMVISTIIKGIRNIDNFPELVRAAQQDKMLRNMIVSMDKVYKQSFGLKDPETTPIQELIYPSEIGAVLASRPTTMNYTAIKKII